MPAAAGDPAPDRAPDRAPDLAADATLARASDRRTLEQVSTTGSAYTERLAASVGTRNGWRRWLDPQRPYRWNIRRMHLGRVLDVGCGVGRYLAHLDGNGVGVDHNQTSISAARERGLVAYTSDEFPTSPEAVLGAFDTMLVAHVLEHMTESEAIGLVSEYLPYVRPGGRVVAICPQERGQRSDATHVTFLPAARLGNLLAGAGVTVDSSTSFPLPTVAGRWFTHNETIVSGTC